MQPIGALIAFVKEGPVALMEICATFHFEFNTLLFHLTAFGTNLFRFDCDKARRKSSKSL